MSTDMKIISTIKDYQLWIDPQTSGWTIVKSSDKPKHPGAGNPTNSTLKPAWSLSEVESISVLPTLKCNLKCPHCYYTSEPANNMFWDDRQLADFITLLKSLKVKHLTIGGGEPLIWPGFIPLLRQVYTCGVDVFILTNGLNIPKDLQQLLSENDNFKRTAFQISIDASNPELYAKVRGGNWEHLQSNIKLLSGTGAGMSYSYTLSSLNAHDVIDFVVFAKKHNFRLLHFPIIERAGRALSNDLQIPPDIISILEFLEYVAIFEEIPVYFVSTTLETWSKGQVKSSCSAADSQISFGADGWIYPCSELMHDSFRIARLGCSTKELETAVINLRADQGFGSDLAETACPDCEIKYLCAGDCRAETLSSNPDKTFKNVGINEQRCKISKSMFYTTLWLFLSRKGAVELGVQDIVSPKTMQMIKAFKEKLSPGYVK